MMRDDFLKPDEKKVQRFINDLKKMDSRRGSPYTQNTLNDFRIALKRFYLWKFDSLDSKTLDLLKKQESRTNKRSEDILSADEVKDIIGNAKSPRDKFLISLAYDSGCRISEFLTMRIRDVKPDSYGIQIHVTGKTGERKVSVWEIRLSDSLNDWQFIREGLILIPGFS